jgi:hypothetical protein
LYKATNFPYEWELSSTLIDDFGIDSTLFRYDNKWWMFATRPGLDGSLFLLYADDLYGPWREHPKNPVIAGDLSLSRPGGRSFVFDGDRIIRIAQKGDVRYGEQVRAFEVVLLSESEYEEQEVTESPILTEGTGWNETGMHHFDPWWTAGGYWLSAVDGDNDFIYAIGIYVTDNDTDSDGTPNYIDQCVDDPGKIAPGLCGCGTEDIDANLDGIVDCFDPDDDGDGLSDEEEQGPSGDDLTYDGNGDGIPDRLQASVCSLSTIDKSSYVTLASDNDRPFSHCEAVDNISTADTPANVKFPYGFFQFTLEGLELGSSAAVSLILPGDENVDTYYMYGPTPDRPSDHWYEFLSDGQTGASFSGNIIRLDFVDAGKGDDILEQDNRIVDFGGPGIMSSDSSNGNPEVEGSSDGGGGGGCFIRDIMQSVSIWNPN